MPVIGQSLYLGIDVRRFIGNLGHLLTGQAEECPGMGNGEANDFRYALPFLCCNIIIDMSSG